MISNDKKSDDYDANTPSIRVEKYAERTEDIEMTLDEADKAAEISDVRYMQLLF